MVNKPKRKQLGPDAQKIGDVKKRSAAIQDEIIWRAVKGEPGNPWPLDLAHKAAGSFKTRFNAADDQILLWAILDCAQRGKRVPKWATEALGDRLFRAAKGEFKDWDGAFGKIYAKGKRQGRIRTLARMIDVWLFIEELEGKHNKEFFERVGKKLKIGTVGSASTVSKLYGEIKRYFESVHGKKVLRKFLVPKSSQIR